MAEEVEEEIIIIEDSDAAIESAAFDEAILAKKSSTKKPLIIIGIATFIILIIIVVISFLKSDSPNIYDTTLLEKKLDQQTTEPIKLTKLENMISKADYLYSNGSKNEALSLYKKIAQFSESVSSYNLGVAQLKNKQYELALKTFKKAIKNNEKKCVSAINAAVCSSYLNDEKSFRYYLNLAHAYLPQESQSSMYSYYYTLINYYNENYFEALSALKNPTTSEYKDIQNNLSAKINALFDNNYDAIENIEENKNYTDDFSLGLLYARIGDLEIAKRYFQESIKKNIAPMKSQIALGYINLKSGDVVQGAKEIENITDMFGEKAYLPYPMKVTLKKSLFNIDKAQDHYRQKIIKKRETNYQKIFYFSPYKIFNANQTIDYIRKGNANIFIDNISEAKTFLKKGGSFSSVNIGITKAIKKALSFKIREANTILQKLVKIQPKHSILHYNLALTYAQMGNMQNAHKHFLRSYNLDAKNYLSAVYAIMTSQLINKENKKLLSIVKNSINDEEFNEKIDLYKTLLFISEDNILATSNWLNKDYKQRPLYLAINIIIAMGQNNLTVAKESSKTLTFLMPNEILPHLMYIDANFNHLSPKKYADKVANYLKVQKFNFDDLYFGPLITRHLYIQQNLITGRLFFLREQLKNTLETTKNSTYELTAALALTSLYHGAFEEAYTLYNNLIDNLKVRDAHTLFLGAVASTAASHHENAIALLELSKMKNPTFLESRYALGLLYLEIMNNKGAIIQLSKINKNNFRSEYFNFDIDLDKLLFQKNQTTNQ
jgi:tetratricopeptide (TPR) repeat protein